MYDDVITACKKGKFVNSNKSAWVKYVCLFMQITYNLDI